MKYLIIIILFFHLSAQAINIDSLIVVTQKNVDFHYKYDAFEKLTSYYLNRDLDSAIIFADQFQQLGEEHANSKFLSKAYTFKAEIAEKKAEYDNAIKYYEQAQKVYAVKKDTFNTSEVLKCLGRVYSEKNDFANAIKYYLESDALKEILNDQKGKASIYNSIGALYYDEENYKEALAYYQKSLKIAEDLDFKFAIGILHMNIGNIYNQLDSTNYFVIDSVLQSDSIRTQKAKEHFLISLQISEDLNNLVGMSNAYSSLGTTDSTMAIEYFKKALAVRQKIGDVRGQWEALKNIAATYYLKKDYQQAQVYAQEALDIAIDNKILTSEQKSYNQLSNIYRNLENYKLAYQTLDSYVYLKDTLDKAKKESDFAQLARKWNYEKKEKENQLLTTAKELDEARIAKQRLYLWASGLGLLLFSFLIFFILRGYAQKRKANILLTEQKQQITTANEELNQQAEELHLLNENLNQQNEEITAQRDEIEKQKDIVEEIHHEISESINYATRLQGAILPEEKVLKKYLAEHFVLLKPKDKVSGDFYWWTHIENHTIITAADCTGHGVPGAFMSMLGASFLREIVEKEFVTHTGVILRKLRREIIKALKQTGEAGTQKDGMDMALISINHENNTVQFSGANNPLYIITSDELRMVSGEKSNLVKLCDNSKLKIETSKLFYEVKPDKMPIAIYEKMDAFTTHEIQLAQGDILYMFSDGFADQFGGPKGKKFKYKPFKRLLLENADKPMTEQKEILNQAFEDWKGNLEQIDDVVVLGIKI